MSAPVSPSLFSLSLPESPAVPLVVAVPHAGRTYAPDFLKLVRQPLDQLHRAEDRFVDILFDSAPKLGAAYLQALFPRVWCDVNRDRRELDSQMFKPPLSQTNLLRSAKVRAGFGVIPRCSSAGRAIYSRCLPPDEMERRIAAGWVPYHQALVQALERMYERFGYVILLDAHSMPPVAQARRCDIVLGDRHGHSCSPTLIGFLQNAFERAGYATQRNVPYAGGYVTQHYGQPENGVHVVQIELCRSLYMNGATLTPSRNFVNVRQDIKSVLHDLVVNLLSGGGLSGPSFMPLTSCAAE